MATRTQPARFILHPTDFSPESELAFAHALRLAVTNQAELHLLHVGGSPDMDLDWDRFPAVRQTLQKWGLLEPGARRSDISQLGIGIDKLIAEKGSVVDAISGYLVRRPIDLLVVSTHGRRGLAAWLHPSTAEATARKTSVPTLFVPADCRGCVAIDSGQVTMDQVLVPVDHRPPCEEAIDRGLRAIEAYGHDQSRLTLLHVGPESKFPVVDVPNGRWNIVRVAREGNPVSEILATAEECMANLLIMVTEGSHGYLDILRGTTTEQVLRQAPCPVLSVSAHF
jgi:nucleotide-binding universal stress UspA family protein